MARTRRKARADASTALFASILQSLVDSGHVSVQDIGRLAQVSKEMNRGATEDEIWASFCQREYSCTKDCKLAFIESEKDIVGSTSTGRPLLSNVVHHRKILVRPPASLDNMFFHIQVSYDGTSLFADTFGATAFAQFLFSCGNVGIAIGNASFRSHYYWQG